MRGIWWQGAGNLVAKCGEFGGKGGKRAKIYIKINYYVSIHCPALLKVISRWQNLSYIFIYSHKLYIYAYLRFAIRNKFNEKNTEMLQEFGRHLRKFNTSEMTPFAALWQIFFSRNLNSHLHLPPALPTLNWCCESCKYRHKADWCNNFLQCFTFCGSRYIYYKNLSTYSYLVAGSAGQVARWAFVIQSALRKGNNNSLKNHLSLWQKDNGATI